MFSYCACHRSPSHICLFVLLLRWNISAVICNQVYVLFLVFNHSGAFASLNSLKNHHLNRIGDRNKKLYVSSTTPTLLSEVFRVYLDRLFAPLTDTPHAARSARKAQKKSIRISSPAHDCSKIRLKTPRRPGFLRSEYGRRSRTYFPEREETPNPQGQINLRCSTAESLRGSPCSSQDTSNEPNARAGKGKKNGRRGTANGKGTG